MLDRAEARRPLPPLSWVTNPNSRELYSTCAAACCTKVRHADLLCTQYAACAGFVEGRLVLVRNGRMWLSMLFGLHRVRVVSATRASFLGAL